MGSIRTKAVCVFRRGNKILVRDSFDPQKREAFYCPAGGGVEFGETSEAAVRREIMEELEAEIMNPRLLGVLENRFTFDGRPGHEIVFVYAAEFSDAALYTAERIMGKEGDGHEFTMVWLDLDKHTDKSPPIYPEGLVALLNNKQLGQPLRPAS